MMQSNHSLVFPLVLCGVLRVFAQEDVPSGTHGTRTVIGEEGNSFKFYPGAEMQFVDGQPQIDLPGSLLFIAEGGLTFRGAKLVEGRIYRLDGKKEPQPTSSGEYSVWISLSSDATVFNAKNGKGASLGQVKSGQMLQLLFAAKNPQGWHKVRMGGEPKREGWMKGDGWKSTIFRRRELVTGDLVVIIADGAKLRAGDTVLATLSRGQQLKVVKLGREWVLAILEQDAKQVTGWVQRDMVALAKESLKQPASLKSNSPKSGLQPGATVAILKDGAEVTKGKRVIAWVRKGILFHITEVRDGWVGGYFEIAGKRTSGWIRTRQVGPLETNTTSLPAMSRARGNDIATVRVILPEGWELSKTMLKQIESTYQPYDVELVVGRPSSNDPLDEDAVLVATVEKKKEKFSSQYRTSYHWIDMKRGQLVLGGQVSSFSEAHTECLLPPLFLRDLTPFALELQATDAETGFMELVDGVPSNDGRYIYYLGPQSRTERDKTPRENELRVLDMNTGKVASRYPCPGAPSLNPLTIYESRLYCCSEGGLRVFDLAGMPALAPPTFFFDGKRVSQLAFHGDWLLAVADERLQRISIKQPTLGQVTLAYDHPIEDFQIGPSGRIWLFEKPAAPESENVTVRMGRIDASGTIRVEGVTTTEQLGARFSYRLGETIALSYDPYDSSSPELRILDIRGNVPRLVRTIPVFPAEDVQFVGENVLIVNGPVLRIFGLDQASHDLRHLLDVPLGWRLPVNAIDVFKDFTVVDLVLSMAGTRGKIRMSDGDIVGYCGGFRIGEGKKFAGLAQVTVIKLPQLLKSLGR